MEHHKSAEKLNDYVVFQRFSSLELCGIRDIVMIHGACMCWQMLMRSAELLAEKFHVYIVAVTGHDIDANEEFTSVENTSRRIESQLISMGA